MRSRGIGDPARWPTGASARRTGLDRLTAHVALLSASSHWSLSTRPDGCRRAAPGRSTTALGTYTFRAAVLEFLAHASGGA